METVVKQAAAAAPKAQPEETPAVAAKPALAVKASVAKSSVAKTAVKTPARKPVAKNTVVKKPALKKPSVEKTVAKKPAVRKPIAKKPIQKTVKPVAKKAVAKRPAANVAKPVVKTVKPTPKAVQVISAEEGMKRMSTALKPGAENEAVIRHSLHVAKLAAQLFEQLGAFHGLGKVWRERLLWAGLLHDFAYNQGKKGHHKAAKKLIEQDVTLPLSVADRPFVALLARFHRKGIPTMKHRDLLSLPVTERRNVIAASALLRLADGLDYQHDQKVEKVECAFDKKTLGVLVHANGKVKASIARALKKAKNLVEAKLVINAPERTVKPLREVKPIAKPVEQKPLATKKPVAKRPATKQTTAKKVAVRKPVAKKPLVRKAVTKRPVPKKPVAAKKPVVKTSAKTAQ